MRYMLLRNIYIRSSYSLHSSPVLLKRSVFFSQLDCYHNLKSSSCYFFLTSSTVHPSPLHIRTQTVTHPGILIPYTRLTGTMVPPPTCVSELTRQPRLECRFHTPDLTGTTVPPPTCVAELTRQTPPGISIPHAGFNWDHGPTLFSCFYHNTDFEIVTVIPVFGA